MKRSRASSPKLKPESDNTKPISFDFEAIGTTWRIELFGTARLTSAERLKDLVLRRIGTFDRDYSRFRADSLVTTMSKTMGRYTLPADAEPLMDIYRQLYSLTGGLMTPLIARTLVSAGYDAAYSLQADAAILPPQTWDEALDYHYPELIIKQPALLDFGAAGKGYLVDIIGELLESNGVTSYCINAGGDIRYRSESGSNQRLPIALEHPADPSQAIGVASISGQSLCGSSGNRRSWHDFHHIINPSTLQSPRHIEALWVVANDTLTADALSTALFFVAPMTLRTAFSFEYAIIQADYSLEHSAGFPGEFFTT